ncbi:hypothetical protein KKF55_00520 [Patescibacteria group bacterium]|nr:hypothetical protein [Patescibacteria group bacterium]
MKLGSYKLAGEEVGSPVLMRDNLRSVILPDGDSDSGDSGETKADLRPLTEKELQEGPVGEEIYDSELGGLVSDIGSDESDSEMTLSFVRLKTMELIRCLADRIGGERLARIAGVKSISELEMQVITNVSPRAVSYVRRNGINSLTPNAVANLVKARVRDVLSHKKGDNAETTNIPRRPK